MAGTVFESEVDHASACHRTPPLFLVTAAAAQNCIALRPSGQPVLAGIAPSCRNTVPAAVVRVAGNAAFQLHCVIVHPAVPLASPMFLLLGNPTPPATQMNAALLNPAYGLPGWLAMPSIGSWQAAGPAGTPGTTPVSVPIPPGLGARGLAFSAQIAVFTPGGIGLTGAVGIVL